MTAEAAIGSRTTNLRATLVHPDDIYAFSWADIDATAKILPELEDHTSKLIDSFLGYIPHCSVTLPYEVSLRGLINSFRYGLCSEEEYLRQAEGYIKLIRNEDFRYDTCDDYDQSIYDNYWQTFQPYGNIARERIASFLGYEPELRHSVAAELWLRDVLARDTQNLGKLFTQADCKVLTLIRYRQALLLQGKNAADTSSLITNEFR